MQFSKEQIDKAIAAKTAEELLEMAKAEGFSLTEEEAEHYFKVLHTDLADAECMELSAEEQENVAGGSQCVGGKSYSSDPPYHLITTAGNSCPLYYEGQPLTGLTPKGTCWHCINKVTDARQNLVTGWGNIFTVTYCRARTIDNDPYR